MLRCVVGYCDICPVIKDYVTTSNFNFFIINKKLVGSYIIHPHPKQSISSDLIKITDDICYTGFVGLGKHLTKASINDTVGSSIILILL